MEHVKKRQSLSEIPIHYKQTLLFAGIVIVAANLRPALTSVGPLIPLIQGDIGLSQLAAGSLTTLSLLTFAFISPLVPNIAGRIGQQYTLLFGLGVLFTGIVIRYFPHVTFLLTGSLFIGAGIAILNVMLPGIIKESFPYKIGRMTSIYTTSMVLTASLGSGISIPLAQGASWGWQMALFIWVIPVIIAAFCWFLIAGHQEARLNSQAKTVNKGSCVYLSPLAWQVTMFMGLQSIGYYVTITWLPEILNQLGNLSLSYAGWMVGLMQAASLPAAFAVPIMAGKFRNQRGIILIIGAIAVSGLILLLLSSSKWFLIVAVVLIGIGQGGSISLSLALLSMRASTSQQAANLSGMAQFAGYFFAAIGPFLGGVLYDVTGGWLLTICMLVVVSLAQVAVGMGAGRDQRV
ncbi:CynX/NimT family MFS transporter [Halobacillus andaensis]|uniref:CynX/NimT family MFS transporter n=1 Tax=Halobacillus andaensis TaxID=1176239 RepID=UPI003D73C367